MAQLTRLIQELKSRLEPLGKAALRWEKAVAAADTHSKPVLPLRDEIRSSINLQSLSSSAVPEVYSGLVADELRKSVQTHYWRVAVLAATARPDVLRTLSSIAHDSALGRTLIDDADEFDVSGRSVLVALAMNNYLHTLIRWSKERDNSLLQNRELQQNILWPLRAADHYFDTWRPGDLWWMDLVTRTLGHAVRTVTREFRDKATLKATGPVFVEFVRRCSLVKIISVDLLGPELAQLAKYDQLPGLATLTADSGAGALRNTICTELVANLANDESGLQQIAFLQMMKALSRPDGSCEWESRIFLARLFWELMEFDEELLARLRQSGPAATSMTQAVMFLREGLKQTVPDDQLHLELRFRDIWASLSEWDEFGERRAVVPDILTAKQGSLLL